MINEMKKTNENVFLNVNDVMSLLSCSKSMSYQIIQTLNKELKKQNYITVSGKVSKTYFQQRMNVSF